MLEPYRSIQFLRVGADQQGILESHIIVEAPVALMVNGEVWTTFMCTPAHLEALMIGFLLNEGIIESLTEIVDAQICQSGDNVDVWLTHEATKPQSWTRTSGCTGGVTAITSIKRPQPIENSLNYSFDRESEGTRKFTLSSRQVTGLVDLLFESQELYRKTGGIHTSILSDGERVIHAAEDIGRHNTLDKIAGLCLLKNTRFSHGALVTTGRISSEMLQKAARMGIAILISRTSPTSLSIELAEAWGITMIGYARRERFHIYTHSERILVSESRINIPPIRD